MCLCFDCFGIAGRWPSFDFLVARNRHGVDSNMPDAARLPGRLHGFQAYLPFSAAQSYVRISEVARAIERTCHSGATRRSMAADACVTCNRRWRTVRLASNGFRGRGMCRQSMRWVGIAPAERALTSQMPNVNRSASCRRGRPALTQADRVRACMPPHALAVQKDAAVAPSIGKSVQCSIASARIT